MKLRDRLQHYFVSGFFTLVPISLSVVVVFWLVRATDAVLSQPVDAAFGFHVPGLGLAAAALVILGAGALASHVAGERMLGILESAIMRLPAFKWVYGTIKQMTEAFSPEKKSSLKSVVVIEYPRPGVYSLGFVTSETSLALGEKTPTELMAVYVPTNHIYIGDVVLVPKDKVIATEIGVQQGIQTMLSAGATLPARLDHPSPRSRR